MKHFSKHWKASKKPSKQRKYRMNAPLHIRTKFVSVNLIKELRGKVGKRNIPIRKGDTVKVLRGQYKKKTGKILSVDKLACRVTMEGVELTKRDGSKVQVALQPSNLQITELVMDDKERKVKLDKTGVKK